VSLGWSLWLLCCISSWLITHTKSARHFIFPSSDKPPMTIELTNKELANFSTVRDLQHAASPSLMCFLVSYYIFFLFFKIRTIWRRLLWSCLSPTPKQRLKLSRPRRLPVYSPVSYYRKIGVSCVAVGLKRRDC
jgi:hypothetical protein